MGWQDRDYNQSGAGSGTANPVLNALMGSVPLGTWFGIRVRVHASLIIFMVLTTLFESRLPYFDIRIRLFTMAALFLIILLHEFGHCFASRAVGGHPEEILMWPLGGLAFSGSPHRPWARFVTVAGGPAVNVLICVVIGVTLYLVYGGVVPINPFGSFKLDDELRVGYTPILAYWVYNTSYMLLLFNLLPIFPLDGGQLLQSTLWARIGYYRSMAISTVTGMVGAVVVGLYGLVTAGWMLVALAIAGFIECRRQRLMIREMGPDAMGEADMFEMSAYQSQEAAEPKRKRPSARAIKKAQKAAAEERAEQERIDEILAKVSARGMNSLTWLERRALKKATERQRQRDLELSRRYS